MPQLIKSRAPLERAAQADRGNSPHSTMTAKNSLFVTHVFPPQLPPRVLPLLMQCLSRTASSSCLPGGCKLFRALQKTCASHRTDPAGAESPVVCSCVHYGSCTGTAGHVCGAVVSWRGLQVLVPSHVAQHFWLCSSVASVSPCVFYFFMTKGERNTRKGSFAGRFHFFGRIVDQQGGMEKLLALLPSDPPVLWDSPLAGAKGTHIHSHPFPFWQSTQREREGSMRGCH